MNLTPKLTLALYGMLLASCAGPEPLPTNPRKASALESNVEIEKPSNTSHMEESDTTHPPIMDSVPSVEPERTETIEMPVVAMPSLKLNYREVRQEIFETSCMSCHPTPM